MMKIYQVGGSVRDKFLDIKSNDIDFAVEANSYDIMYKYLEKNYIIVFENKKFFTVKVRGKNGLYYDFVLCRKENSYSDGRHPDLVKMGTIIDDLARRDFTMNAIAIDDQGTIIDPFGGQDDIANKVIRCVGSTDRLLEDSLRLIRAIRVCYSR